MQLPDQQADDDIRRVHGYNIQNASTQSRLRRPRYLNRRRAASQFAVIDIISPRIQWASWDRRASPLFVAQV